MKICISTALVVVCCYKVLLLISCNVVLESLKNALSAIIRDERAT